MSNYSANARPISLSNGNLNYDPCLNAYQSPQFRNLTNSLKTLRPKSSRMRFSLFKLAFCHILTDMSV